MSGKLPGGGYRAVARCDALGVRPYSDIDRGLYRAYLTPAYVAAQRMLADWMVAAGMTVARDAAGNLIGRYPGTSATAPSLMIGSHLDSVRDGGRYDGALGIMLGIECVDALRAQDRRLPFPIDVIAFGDEEGSRFPTAMLTSRAVAGTLDPAMLDTVDAAGVPLELALAEAGLDHRRFAEAARTSKPPFAYLEAHIEQGPVLEAADLPIGVVSGIAGQRRYGLTVTGVAGHAGTSNMTLRRDALAAAAEMILAAEAVAREGAAGLVATVGRLEVSPGAANVIPGTVTFTLDVRAGRDDVRDAATRAILNRWERTIDARDVALTVEELQTLPAAPCDETLTSLLEESVRRVGVEPRRLVSGAGHDAMVMAALCPTAMLFVRCEGGVSHHPAESVEPADVEIALVAMLDFLKTLEGRSHG